MITDIIAVTKISQILGTVSQVLYWIITCSPTPILPLQFCLLLFRLLKTNKLCFAYL